MSEADDDSHLPKRKLIGIGLALSGNLLVSVALNLTKHAHNLNQRRAEPLPYVKLPLWWLGFAATLLGELGNFGAYGFAEASVVAPLGAVSVLANAFIAALVLGEGLRLRDLLGCALCVVGGVVIVLNTPSQSVDTDIDVFLTNVKDPVFVTYIALLVLVVLVMLGFQDKYGHEHVGYYVLLCSLIGSVTVMACKGVSTFLTLWICCGADAPFRQPVLYILLLVLTSTAVLQIRYLNQAMENFGNTETVPVYYVMFTICTIAGSTILYRDFYNADRSSVFAFGVGVLLTFVGVKLLTSSTDGGSEVDVEDDGDGGFETPTRGAKASGRGTPPRVVPPPSDDDVPLGELYVPLESYSDPPLNHQHHYHPPVHTPHHQNHPHHHRPTSPVFASPSLMHQPMGMSGDMLLRTFSVRASTNATAADADADVDAGSHTPLRHARRGSCTGHRASTPRSIETGRGRHSIG